MSANERVPTEVNPECCAASGQPLPADAAEAYTENPECTHFKCPECGDLLELPPTADGLIPEHMPRLGGADEPAAPTFNELLDNPDGLIQALASIQLKGKQRSQLAQLFASADGEEVRRDIGNRVQSDTRHSCSVIGGHLTNYFGGVGPRDKMSWIGYIQPDAYGAERWVLKSQIRSALVHLGWFGPGPVAPAATVPVAASSKAQSPQDEGDPTEDQALLAAVQKSMQDDAATRSARLAAAPKLPEKYPLTATAFKRNPDVIAAVLIRSAGSCEACQQAAPFLRASDGTPYLEVHHKVPLAIGGFDTVDHAAAICPNCHRKAHNGSPDPSGASGGSGGSLQ